MRTWPVILLCAGACASNGSNQPSTSPYAMPRPCAGDRKVSVVNNSATVIDIRNGSSILGTIQPGAQAEYTIAGNAGVFAVPAASATSRFGLNRDDRKLVIIGYTCVDAPGKPSPALSVR